MQARAGAEAAAAAGAEAEDGTTGEARKNRTKAKQ